MEFRAIFAGLTTIDIQYFTPDYPESNRKIKTQPPDLLVGGPSTNAAVACSVLNNGATLVSAVGKSPFSGFIMKDFQQNGIQHIDLIPDSENIPVLASVITETATGNRNIFTHHPESVNPDILPREKFNSFKPDIIMFDGFYPEVFIDWAVFSKMHKIPVVLDCGSWKDQYINLIPHADVIICSEDFHPPGCSTPAEIFNFLSDSGAHKSAISRGEKSLLFFEYNIIQEIPVEHVKIKDTLGAGDFLHGAFCYYYLDRKSVV